MVFLCVESEMSLVAKLTDKQKKFIDEYLVDLSATQAAIRAEYKEKAAYRTGAANLRKPQIQKEIQKRMQERQQRTEVPPGDSRQGIGGHCFV